MEDKGVFSISRWEGKVKKAAGKCTLASVEARGEQKVLV
jgi:hypothetical protein